MVKAECYGQVYLIIYKSDEFLVIQLNWLKNE